MSAELGIIIFVIVFVAISRILIYTGKRDMPYEQNYLIRLSQIKQIIENHEVCEQNFKYISFLLDDLRSMKWKDPRRTDELRDLFYEKYREFIDPNIYEAIIASKYPPDDEYRKIGRAT